MKLFGFPGKTVLKVVIKGEGGRWACILLLFFIKKSRKIFVLKKPVFILHFKKMYLVSPTPGDLVVTTPVIKL